MVATLVKLKWRLTLNALTKNTWAIVGTVIGALYGLGVLGMVLAGAVGLGLEADPQVIALLTGALGALLVAGWPWSRCSSPGSTPLWIPERWLPGPLRREGWPSGCWPQAPLASPAA